MTTVHLHIRICPSFRVCFSLWQTLLRSNLSNDMFLALKIKLKNILLNCYQAVSKGCFEDRSGSVPLYRRTAPQIVQTSTGSKNSFSSQRVFPCWEACLHLTLTSHQQGRPDSASICASLTGPVWIHCREWSVLIFSCLSLPQIDSLNCLYNMQVDVSSVPTHLYQPIPTHLYQPIPTHLY